MPIGSNLISSVILFGTIALAPLPFGSTDPASIALWCTALGISLIFVSPRALRPPHFALLGGVAVVICCYAFDLHEQLSTHPFVASPHPLWHRVAEALGTPLAPVVSIAHNQPFFALGAPLAAILSLICSLIVCADRVRARQLLKVIAWSGAIYSIFGIASFLIEPSRTLWRASAYPNALTATFVNRNTAAAYFGSCAVVWVLMLCDAIRRRLPDGPIEWRALSRKLFPAREVLGPLSMFSVCLVAMFLTGSRGGVLASLVALVVAFLGIFHRRLARLRAWLVVLTVLVSVALLSLQIIGAGVSSRLENQGLADEGRLAAYRSTLHMIADHPWFGTGLGTFVWNFPAYRGTDMSMAGVWDRAHDSFLEIAAECGLPLAVLAAVAWIIALAILINGIRLRRRDLILPVTAFAVSLLALLHSLIDFSLQIPGYAIVVFALAGSGISQSFASERRIEQPLARFSDPDQASDQARVSAAPVLNSLSSRQSSRPDPPAIA